MTQPNKDHEGVSQKVLQRIAQALHCLYADTQIGDEYYMLPNMDSIEVIRHSPHGPIDRIVFREGADTRQLRKSLNIQYETITIFWADYEESKVDEQ